MRVYKQRYISIERLQNKLGQKREEVISKVSKMVNMRIFCTGRTLQNTFLIHLLVNCGKTVIIL